MLIKFEMGPEYHRTVKEIKALGKDVEHAASVGLEEAAQLAASHVSEYYLKGQSLKMRTGLLSKSLTSWMVSDHEAVVGIPENSPVGKYAWLLGDETKTITPKKGKYLTIPIGEALTPAGNVKAKYQSPRLVPDGFFIKSKGQLLFGYKQGKRGKFRALFVLVRSVTIHGSGALLDGVIEVEDKMKKVIEDEIGKIKDVD